MVTCSTKVPFKVWLMFPHFLFTLQLEFAKPKLVEANDYLYHTTFFKTIKTPKPIASTRTWPSKGKLKIALCKGCWFHREMLITPLMNIVRACLFAPYVVFLVLLGRIPPPFVSHTNFKPTTFQKNNKDIYH